jgi:hypothetical protein
MKKKKHFFEFEQMYKDNNNNISSGLQRKNDIECYDKIMESYPNYHSIVSIYVRKFMERPKIFTIPKVKSMLKNINHMMVFFILL